MSGEQQLIDTLRVTIAQQNIHLGHQESQLRALKDSIVSQKSALLALHEKIKEIKPQVGLPLASMEKYKESLTQIQGMISADTNDLPFAAISALAEGSLHTLFSILHPTHSESNAIEVLLWVNYVENRMSYLVARPALDEIIRKKFEFATLVKNWLTYAEEVIPAQKAVENAKQKLHQTQLDLFALQLSHDKGLEVCRSNERERRLAQQELLRLQNLASPGNTLEHQARAFLSDLQMAIDKHPQNSSAYALANQAFLIGQELVDEMTAVPGQPTAAEHVEDLTLLRKSFKLTEAVLLDPQNQAAIQALKDHASEEAIGKSSTWEKFFGALTLLAGACIIALSVAGIPFTGGASATGMYLGGSLLCAGGAALFYHGREKYLASALVDLAEAAPQATPFALGA